MARDREIFNQNMTKSGDEPDPVSVVINSRGVAGMDSYHAYRPIITDFVRGNFAYREIIIGQPSWKTGFVFTRI